MYFICLINCLIRCRNKTNICRMGELVVKLHRSSIMNCREVTKIRILDRIIVHRKMY